MESILLIEGGEPNVPFGEHSWTEKVLETSRVWDGSSSLLEGLLQHLLQMIGPHCGLRMVIEPKAFVSAFPLVILFHIMEQGNTLKLG